MDDWKSEIVKAVIVRQRLEELDGGGLFEYPLPEVAASEDEVSATEAALGFALDEQYRRFLRFANGWRCLLQAVDLFGTRQLVGPSLMDVARAQLDSIDDADFEHEVGCRVADVLPIGASGVQSDMFLLGLPGSPIDGQVVWLAGTAVDRFSGFDDFFLAMVDYNRRQIEYFERGS
jgi:hypothetical protein